MKPTEEQIKAYQEMANASPCSMKTQIKNYLEAHCQKFVEDKLDRCIEYLNDIAMEILDGQSGDVPDKVCFRICQDYFDEETWKKEDMEKAKAKEDTFTTSIDDVEKQETCPRCRMKTYYLHNDGLCSTCHAKAEKEKNNPQLSLF